MNDDNYKKTLIIIYEYYFNFIKIQLLDPIQIRGEQILLNKNQIKTLQIYCVRFVSCINSLKKLIEVSDIQSVAHIMRLTFELLIDFSYFSIPTDKILPKNKKFTLDDVEFWEKSAKLNLLEKEKNALGSLSKIKEVWLLINKSKINKERQLRGWIVSNEPFHRSSWARGDLASDAKFLDKIYILDNLNFEKIYFQHIAQANLFIHGRGCTLIKDLSIDGILNKFLEIHILCIINIRKSIEQLIYLMHLNKDDIFMLKYKDLVQIILELLKKIKL